MVFTIFSDASFIIKSYVVDESVALPIIELKLSI